MTLKQGHFCPDRQASILGLHLLCDGRLSSRVAVMLHPCQTQYYRRWLCLSRSLDLTGPLLLGGVPNLPEDFPVHSRQFVGCMRNLSVDGRIVDMAAFIANNGTRAGVHSPWVYRASMVPTGNL